MPCINLIWAILIGSKDNPKSIMATRYENIFLSVESVIFLNKVVMIKVIMLT